MSEYTKEKCLTDVMAILPYAQSVTEDWGILATCACCAAKSHGVVVSESSDRSIVLALCKRCLDCGENLPSNEAWKMGRNSYLQIPVSEADRKMMVRMLRESLIFNLSEQKALPVVMHLLELDQLEIRFKQSSSLGIVVRQAGKRVRAFRCPVPWYPEDPFMVGGQFARDASALVKSIQRGKTKGHFFPGGSMMFTSSDDSLMKEWGRP